MKPSELMTLTVGEMESRYGIDKHRDENKEEYVKRVSRQLNKEVKSCKKCVPIKDFVSGAGSIAEPMVSGIVGCVYTKKQPKDVKVPEITGEVSSVDENPQPLIDYTAPIGVSVSFPTNETWQINYRGREDSGHISADLQAAINQIIK